MSSWVVVTDDRAMPLFLLHHRHRAEDCSAVFAAWNGFRSPLRGTQATSSCRWGGHEIWWDLECPDQVEALQLLPRYVADRTLVMRVGLVDIP
jgi:hypothetical protein